MSLKRILATLLRLMATNSSARHVIASIPHPFPLGPSQSSPVRQKDLRQEHWPCEAFNLSCGLARHSPGWHARELAHVCV